MPFEANRERISFESIKSMLAVYVLSQCILTSFLHKIVINQKLRNMHFDTSVPKAIVMQNYPNK